jgi:hypothetical protein
MIMMMMMMMMMMVGVCMVAAVSSVIAMNSDSFNTTTVAGTDPPSTGSGNDTTGNGTNCYVTAQANCSQHKGGKERGWCIGKEKKKCMEAGGYWDPSQQGKEDLEEKKKTIVQSWDGADVDVLPQAYNDINENCVYFYDSDPWNQAAPKYRGHGWACLGDGQALLSPVEGQQFHHVGQIKNKMGTFLESHEKYGDDIGSGPISNHVDYMRVGKNINVTVYDGWRYEHGQGKWNNSQE